MTLQRKKHPMPGFVADALKREKLLKKYNERPPYQRNDYIGWIIRAKRAETKQKRLRQMLSELKRGDAYMNMPWKGEKK